MLGALGKLFVNFVTALRSGLTWKEWLVCLAIVAVLIALLLPAHLYPQVGVFRARLLAGSSKD
jgi:hypothetical protein